MSELKRCPFCDEELEVHCTGRFYMHKTNGCIIQRLCFETDDEFCTDLWNTRKSMERIVERLEILYDEAQDKLSDDFIYYDGWGDGVDMAMRAVKGEGGLND